MKALTLWQPWASLVAIGEKWIETRPRSTTYRGPLMIHAAATPKGFYSLPGDIEGNIEGGWWYGYVGEYQAAYCFKTSDEGKRGDTYLHDLRQAEPGPCPLGCMVAYAELTDVIPMVTGGDEGAIRTLDIDADGSLWIVEAEKFDPSDAEERHPWATQHEVTSQRPFGDFSPGRYAWLLENVRALDEPIPARGMQATPWEWEVVAI